MIVDVVDVVVVDNDMIIIIMGWECSTNGREEERI
jgi:hypothetical protein